MKYLLIIMVVACFATAGNYVQYGHFQSGCFISTGEWTPDYLFNTYFSETWVDWPQNMFITNIRPSTIDDHNYDTYEFTVPEVDTFIFVLIGIFVIRVIWGY